MLPKAPLILAALMVTVILAFVPGVCLGEDADSVAIDTTNYDDGPHIYWPTDSTAIVFYLYEGEVRREEYSCRDTLVFEGLCADSAASYVVPRHSSIADSYLEGVSRVLSVSDIHGEYDHFVNILTAALVIDEQHDWIFGDGHLVIDGDVFDRGPRVTECLWLIHQLQQQAGRSGGAAHMLLGNHEMMVLRGDNRYIHERYLEGIVQKTRIRHEDLFGPDMAFGEWLRSCATAMVINDVLYSHAGLSPLVMTEGWTLDQINTANRQLIDLTTPAVAFDETFKMLIGSKGPFWYRGYFYEMEGRYPRASESEITDILARCSASAVVVGHSGVDSVASLYDGRVLAIDVDVEALGSLEALLVEDGQFYRIAGDGSRHPVMPFVEE